MTQYMNQLAQTTLKGKLDQQGNPNVFSGRVGQDQATALVPAQAVKLADTTSKIPEFLAAATGEAIFGFVTYSLRKNSFAKGEALEVAAADCVMYMEANTTIAKGAEVETIASGQKVTTALGTNTKVGFAFDKASAQGDLIRVLIKTPCFNETPST